MLELFALLSLVILLTRSAVFGSVGFAISSFLLGVFGYCAYAALAALIYGGAVLITGKRLTAPRKIVVPAVLLFVCLACLVHTITAAAGGIEYGSYGEYLAACYRAGENSFFHTTGGGVLFGIIVYPVAKLTTSVGGYIIFSLLMIGCGYLIYAAVKGGHFARRKKSKPAEQPQQPLAGLSSDTSGIYDLNYAASAPQQYSSEQPYAAQTPAAQPQQSVQASAASPAERSKRLYSVGDEFDMKTRREMRQETRRAEAQQRAQQQTARVRFQADGQGRKVLWSCRRGPPKRRNRRSRKRSDCRQSGRLPCWGARSRRRSRAGRPKRARKRDTAAS